MVINRKKLYRLLVVGITLGLAILALVFGGIFVRGKSNLGIEFAGGVETRVTLDPQKYVTRQSKEIAANKYIEIVNSNIDSLGVSSPETEIDYDSGTITMRIASGKDDFYDAQESISRPFLITLAPDFSYQPGDSTIVTSQNFVRDSAQKTPSSDGSYYDINFSLNQSIDFSRYFANPIPAPGGGTRRANLVFWLDRENFLNRIQNLYLSYTYRNSLKPNEIRRYKALTEKQIEQAKSLQEFLDTFNKAFPTNPINDFSDRILITWISGLLINYVPDISRTYIIAFQDMSKQDELANNTKVTKLGLSVNDSVRASSLQTLINNGSYGIKFSSAPGANSSRIISSTSSNNSLGISPLLAIFIAGLITMFVIFLFLGIIYRLPGIIAGIAIMLFTMLSLVIFTALGGQYSSESLASLIIGIGIAVDANIILFERLKEELARGIGVKQAVRNSSKKTIWTVLDSNITTLIVAVLMMLVGQSIVRGFGTMLAITIFSTILINVILVRFALILLFKRQFSNMKLYFNVNTNSPSKTIQQRIHTKTLSFVINKFSLFNWFSNFIIALSLFVLITGMIVGLTVGLPRNLDYYEGSVVEVIVDPSKRALFNPDAIGLAYTSSVNEAGYEVIRFTSNQAISDNSSIVSQLKQFADANITNSLSIQNTSPGLAQSTLLSAVYAALISIGIIIVYVSIRFSWVYALPAVIALIHDALIIVAFFAMCRITIDQRVMIAILSIIGYSINDTIVTFSSIRSAVDKKHNYSKEELRMLVDERIKSVLSRTILTTLTTISVIIILLIFASTSISLFNVAMLVGLMFGTLSSSYIATKIWYLIFLKVNKYHLRKSLEQKKQSLDNIDEQLIKNINC